MRIFLVTGEPSGDLHGAHLARAIWQLDPAVTICGIGGARMRATGVALEAVSEHWGAIGIPDGLRKLPGLLWQMHRLTSHLRANPPDVLVPIDFGAFNVRLLARLQASDIRSVYYIPPGCWARHRAPGRLPFLVDAIATPFPWSAENLRLAGAPSRIEWVGHPLLEYTRAAAGRDAARAHLGLAGDRPVLALIPGSRRTELRYLLRPFLDAARRITPRPLCLLAVAPSIGIEAMKPALPPDLDIRLLDGIDPLAIRAADAALVASGTATLELACLDVPMVVSYRVSRTGYQQYRLIDRLRGLPYVSLPNILAEAAVVPELMQYDAVADKLAAAVAPLLQETPNRLAQLQAFRDIRGWLGNGQACLRTAEMVLEVGNGQGCRPHCDRHPASPPSAG